MNTIDHFDTKIQVEELAQVLTTDEIDEMAQEDFENAAYDAGWYGEGEGAMPVDLTAEEQTIWIDKFSEGVADVKDHAEMEHAYAAQMDSLYGVD